MFRRREKKATVYIARATDDGRIKESGPCIDCLTALRRFGAEHGITTDVSLEIHNIQSYEKYIHSVAGYLINIHNKPKEKSVNMVINFQIPFGYPFLNHNLENHRIQFIQSAGKKPASLLFWCFETKHYILFD